VVTNTGIEIPESELERIFDKFYRVPSLDPWRHGGTGLGLALAKKLVERLGGIIRAESANNQVEFIVEFPMDWLNFGPTVTV
jgi:signal transduction histidine kinase